MRKLRVPKALDQEEFQRLMDTVYPPDRQHDEDLQQLLARLDQQCPSSGPTSAAART